MVFRYGDGVPLQPLGAVTRCLRDKLGVLRGHVTLLQTIVLQQ